MFLLLLLVLLLVLLRLFIFVRFYVVYVESIVQLEHLRNFATIIRSHVCVTESRLHRFIDLILPAGVAYTLMVSLDIMYYGTFSRLRDIVRIVCADDLSAISRLVQSPLLSFSVSESVVCISCKVALASDSLSFFARLSFVREPSGARPCLQVRSSGVVRRDGGLIEAKTSRISDS